MSDGWIHITGARQNNLKNIDVQIPVNQVTVITGVSGSGKSSLAVDVLYAEGQRRYVESFSAYARQFLDRVDKPQVDRVEGVLPAVMIGRGRPSRNSRSTVGTVTQLQNYLKLLFAKIGKLYCGGCGQEVKSDSPETVEKSLGAERFNGTGILVAFDVTILDNLPWKDMREGLMQAGLHRLFVDGQIVDIDSVHTAPQDLCTVVVDRLVLGGHTKQRVSDSLEQAFQYGKGRIRLIFLDNDTSIKFSDQYECTQCGIA